MNNEKAEQLVGQWAMLLVRGVTLKQPSAVNVQAHKDLMLVHAEFPSNQAGVLATAHPENEPKTEAVDMVVHNCPGCNFTPASSVLMANFEGQWPPIDFIQAWDSRIIRPDAVDTQQILRGKT